MKLLSLILCFSLVGPVVHAATGDVLTTVARADGWTADITLEGMNVGGTYATRLGLGVNNDPATGTPQVTFTVVSLGYDDTGAATTITRQVFGTKRVRKPYPNQALAEESFSTNTTVRIALSDYIYAKDIAGAGFVENVSSGTAPVVSILAGFYTYTGTPNNASGAGFAVTNSSTAAFQKCVANWTKPGFQRVTGNFNLNAVAFHGSGQSGRPVRVVKYTVTDTSSHTVTSTVTSPSIDATLGDAVPVVEYVGTIDVSTLTQGNILTCNFVAYPWMGDSGATLDTSAGTAQPTPLYGPITMLNDKSSTYGVTCALVDPTGSDAGANTVYDSASFNEATAYKFATIGKAASAIAAYNNTNRSRNTVAAGRIVLNDGSYPWTGSSNTYGTTPDSWLTIQRATASAGIASCQITTQVGNTFIGNKVKFSDVTITGGTTITFDVFSGGNYLWFDRCRINSTSVALVYGQGGSLEWYVTGCNVLAIAQGLGNYSGCNAPAAIIRGNTLAGSFASALYTFIGNKRDSVFLNGSSTPLVVLGSAPVPVTHNAVFAYNNIRGWGSPDAQCFPEQLTGRTLTGGGLAFVQNLLENYRNSGQALASIAADGSAVGSDPVENVLLWNNTFVGQRVNAAYNDTGSAAPARRYWSVKNNIFENHNIKTDTFATANAARVGNWPCVWGVGYSGNLNAECTGIGAPASFMQEFPGLKSYQPASANTLGFVQFVNRLASTGAADGAGLGDYHVLPTSPATDLQRDWVLPYDIAGVARSSIAPAGAFSASAVGRSIWFIRF